MLVWLNMAVVTPAQLAAIQAHPDVEMLGSFEFGWRLADISASDRNRLQNILQEIRPADPLPDTRTQATIYSVLEWLSAVREKRWFNTKTGLWEVEAGVVRGRQGPIPGPLSGAYGAGSSSFPDNATPLDDFNRADNASLGGNWTAPYFSGDNSPRIVSNAMAPLAAGGGFSDAVWATSFNADQEAWAQMSALPSAERSTLNLRVQGVGTGTPDSYMISYDPTGPAIDIRRMDNGTPTTIGARITVAYAANVRYGGQCIGNTISAWDDDSGSWAEIGNRYDATYNLSGYIGWESADASAVRINEFGGGNVTAYDITVVNGTLSAAASGTSVTPTLPSHQADDILVVVASCNVGQNISCSTSGWAEIVTAQNSANLSTAWFWKRAASGAETNPQIDFSAAGSTTAGHYATAYRVRGCITTGTPFEDATANGTPTTSNSPASATIDTTSTNRLAVCFVQADDDNTLTAGTWPPLGWTNIGAPQTSTTGGDHLVFAVAKEVPSAATVTGVTVATMSAADYWRTLTVAFIPAPGVTPVGVSIQLVWNVQAAVGKSTIMLWNDSVAVNQDTQLIWHVLVPIGKETQLVWNVQALVNKTTSLLWDQRAVVSQDTDLLWNVTVPVNKTTILLWDISDLVPVGQDTDILWDIRAAVGKDTAAVWNISTLVNKDTQLVWNQLAAIGKSTILLWDDRAVAGKSTILLWNVQAAVNKTTVLLWNDTVPVSQDTQLIWNLRAAVGKSAQLVWDVRAVVNKSRQLVWNVNSSFSYEALGGWDEGLTGTSDAAILQGIWNGAQRVSAARIEVVTDVVDGSPAACKFDVRNGEDPIGGFGDRAEVQQPSFETEGVTRWYAWSTRLASDWPTYPGNGAIFQVTTQFHSAGAGPPPVSFNLDGDYHTLQINYVADDFNEYPMIPWRSAISRGTWRKFRIKVTWSDSDSTGQLELWLDGTKQTFNYPFGNFSGSPVGTPGSGTQVLPVRTLRPNEDAYCKQGYYRTANAAPGGAISIIHHDNWRRATTDPGDDPPGSGGGAVGTERVLLWNINSTVVKTTQLVWNDTVPVAKTTQMVWNDLITAGKSASLLWDVNELADVGVSTSLLWNINTTVSQDTTVVWDINPTPVSQDTTLLWDVIGQVGQDTDLLWNIQATVNKDTILLWNQAAAVAKDTILLWNISVPVGQTTDVLWNLRSAVAQDTQLVWAVDGPAGVPTILLWGIDQTVGQDTSLLWNDQIAVDKSVSMLWSLLETVGTERDLLWNLNHIVGTERSLLWNLNQIVASETSLLWAFEGPVSTAIALRWNVQAAAAQDTDLLWGINTSVAQTRALLWDLSERVGVSRSLLWHLQAPVGASRNLLWSLRANVGAQRSLLWDASAVVGRSGILVWAVDGAVPVSRSLLWDVEAHVGRSTSLLWHISVPVGVDTSLLWTFLDQVGVSRSLLWDVRAPVGQSTTLYWTVVAFATISGQILISPRIGNLNGGRELSDIHAGVSKQTGIQTGTADQDGIIRTKPKLILPPGL